MTTIWLREMLLWSWQALLLMVPIFGLTRILRAKSASLRHSFWLLGLIALALLPIANASIRAFPSVTVPLTTFVPTPITAIVEEEPALAVQDDSSWRDGVPICLFALWIIGVSISL